MTEDSQDMMSAFESSGSFLGTTSTASVAEPVEEEEPSVGYALEVLEPHAVEQPFGYDDLPEIHEPDGREEFDRMVTAYAKKVLLDYGLELEWDRVIVKTDGRLGVGAIYSGSLGRAGPEKWRHAKVRISSKYYVDRGYSWEKCKTTIRHELVHAWQVRWLTFSSHGPTFRAKARELDVDRLERYDGTPEPSYICICQNCGTTYHRQRRSKRVKNPYYACSSCDQSGHPDGDGPVWEAFELHDEWKRVMP